MNLSIKFIPEDALTISQRRTIIALQKECFADVPPVSIKEDFIAESFGKIFAYNDNKIIGMLSLKIRSLTFAGKQIRVGGAGGVCVTVTMRGNGIATKMLGKALAILKKEKCDIACLNVDLEKQAYKLYEKIGFKLMNRPISFETSKGELKYDTGTMFISICSKELYDFVMNNKETFHYGKGYW